MSKGLAIIFVEEMYETLEFHYCRLRLIEAGYKVEVVSPQKGKTYNSKGAGYPATSTMSSSDVKASDVKIAIVPGGYCPDHLRMCPNCVGLLRSCYNGGNGAIIGAICHGPQLGVSADILRGHKVTGYGAIKDDIVNAGGKFIGEERCVADGRLVTAQTPDDLPAFMATVLKVAGEACGCGPQMCGQR